MVNDSRMREVPKSIFFHTFPRILKPFMMWYVPWEWEPLWKCSLCSWSCPRNSFSCTMTQSDSFPVIGEFESRGRENGERKLWEGRVLCTWVHAPRINICMGWLFLVVTWLHLKLTKNPSGYVPLWKIFFLNHLKWHDSLLSESLR